MRLSYTPTYGSHALTRKAGAWPADVEQQVKDLGNEAAYDSKLRDKDTGLDAAERSCMAKLDKIKQQKEQYNKTEAQNDSGADRPAAQGQDSTNSNRGESGVSRPCHASSTRGPTSGDCRGVGSCSEGGCGQSNVFPSGVSLNDQIYVNRYELISENETNHEDTTEYDQMPEETYVTKNLADFETKRIQQSIAEYFEDYDDEIFESVSGLRESDMLDVALLRRRESFDGHHFEDGWQS